MDGKEWNIGQLLVRLQRLREAMAKPHAETWGCDSLIQIYLDLLKEYTHTARVLALLDPEAVRLLADAERQEIARLADEQERLAALEFADKQGRLAALEFADERKKLMALDLVEALEGLYKENGLEI